tara:strand:+ start:1658 stop:2731 length:1074 start_codon:yes stop_codon:yes gene_type:complete
MKVCILGSGLSALTLAKALVNQNIFVDILAPKITSSFNKSRTLGVSKSNVEFFNKHIININNIIWELKKIDIFSDNYEKKLINFENNGKTLFCIIKNHELYEILQKNLSKNKYCKIFNKNKSINFFKNYDLIINTDYSNLITNKFFHKKIVKRYNSTAFTTVIKHEKILNNIATQIFTKKGPIAFLPISNKETSIVYSIEDSKKNLNVDVESLIKKYNFKLKIKKIEKIKKFKLSYFHLRSYYYKNFLAFGDLLHKIHPLAGQGYNMTVRDVKILIKIINNRIDLGLPLDSSVNNEFEKKTKHKNFLFSNGIDLIYEYFNFEKNLNNNILSKTANLIAKNSYINKMFTKIADQGILY